MKTSGNRIGGYETIGSRISGASAGKLRCPTKRNVKNDIEREALEALLATIHELMETRRRAGFGEKRMAAHAADMRRLLRYVKRKVKETAGDANAKHSRSGTSINSRNGPTTVTRKGTMHR